MNSLIDHVGADFNLFKSFLWARIACVSTNTCIVYSSRRTSPQCNRFCRNGSRQVLLLTPSALSAKLKVNLLYVHEHTVKRCVYRTLLCSTDITGREWDLGNS